MTLIQDIVNEVYDNVEWQRLPRQLSAADVKAKIYNVVIDSIRYLYVITGRGLQYSDNLYNIEEGVAISLVNDIDAIEYLYVVKYAQCSFMEKLRTDVNNIVGYTTDAMAITNADKPYQYLTGTINEIKEELRKLFYKMIEHTLL